jgi:hypothetical protein
MRDRAERMLRRGADAVRVSGELGVRLQTVLWWRDEMARTPEENAGVRRAAERMLGAGASPKQVSRAVGVPVGAARSWRRRPVGD